MSSKSGTMNNNICMVLLLDLLLPSSFLFFPLIIGHVDIITRVQFNHIQNSRTNLDFLKIYL